MKKRNHTRVRFISSDEWLTLAGSSITCKNVFKKQIHKQAVREMNGKYSLTVDIEPALHPLDNVFIEGLSTHRYMLSATGTGDFEIVVIEYKDSKSPNIRRFNRDSVNAAEFSFGPEMYECLNKSSAGDRESGEKLYEFVAHIPLDDEVTLCGAKIMTAFDAIRESNAIPRTNLIERIRERLEFARNSYKDIKHIKHQQLISWIESACLKARVHASPASNIQRRSATI